jgi:hypothetical protein
MMAVFSTEITDFRTSTLSLNEGSSSLNGEISRTITRRSVISKLWEELLLIAEIVFFHRDLRYPVRIAR